MADREPLAAWFDTAGARAAGMSDDQIADFLAPQTGFDLAAARKAGMGDSDVVQFLAPVKAEPAPAPVAKPSSALGGIGKTVLQQVAKLPGGIVESAGSTAEVASLIDRVNTRKQLDVFDRIDRGETIKDTGQRGNFQVRQDLTWANQYASKTPEEQAEMRRTAEDLVKAPPDLLQRTGENVRHLGERITEGAEKMHPLTDEEQGRTSVQVTKLLTSMVPYVAAAVTTGGAGLVGYGAVDALGKTYGRAVQDGADPEKAALGAVENGLMQGFINVIPAAHAAKIMERLPEAARGKFVQLLADAALGAGNMLTMTQVSMLAENAVASKTFEPNRPPLEGIGENLKAPAIAGAILPLGVSAAGAAARRFRPRPTAADVMKADTVDDAIHTAAEMARAEPVDVEHLATQAAEYGGVADQQQAALLKTFGGLNEGVVVQGPKGDYAYRMGDQDIPLKVWDGKTVAEGENAITPELAAAQRDAYGQMGIKIIFIDDAGGTRQGTDNPRVSWDGAVDPSQPNTLFLSNNPTRNAAQLGAHELTHVLENVKVGNTTLADVMHDQIREGLTNEGVDHAVRMFGQTAPDRAAFPNTPEGQAAHIDAIWSHLIRELGADIGGEAPRFQTFATRVVDAVEQRFGPQAAKDALRSLLDGIRQAMTRLREFFVHPAEGAEYGQVETVSQRWVTNLEQVHDTLARMYAEKYATQVERERAMLEAQRPQRAPEPQRALPAPALVTPPPRPAITPENVFRPETYGRPGTERPVPSEAPVRPAEALEPIAADLEPGAVPRAPVRPEQKPAEVSLAAHDRLVAAAKLPDVGVPKDYAPTPEETALAERVSRGWTPEVAERQAQSLTDFVRKNGGLRLGTPEAGDLRAADIGRQPGLLRLRGEQADHMAQRAFDNGYRFGRETEIGSGVDTDAFVRALIEDASGRRKHHPDTADTAAWRVQRDYLEHFANYLADIGLDPKGLDPRTVAWVLKQSPEDARLLSLLLKHDRLGEQASIELAYRLDSEAERARAEMTPEPGAWDMGDPRELPQPTRAELERFYADYERATGQGEPDAGGAGRSERAAPGEAAGGEAAGNRPVAGGPSPEAPGAGDRGEGVAFSPRRTDTERPATKREEPFYSALTRAVEGIKTTKATPGQWEGTLRNLPGVKQEERAWSGVDEWLHSQAKPVTKDELLGYLRAHEIRVDEVQKGGQVPESAVAAIRDWVGKHPDVADLTLGEAEWKELARGDSRIIGELEGWGVPGNLMQPVYDSIGEGATKFGTYVQKGGDNYRELLLTLPNDKADRLDARRREIEALGLKATPEQKREWADIMNQLRPDNRDIEGISRFKGFPEFRGSHWDEPNVLAHIRFDDRTGPNGEKVLHVSEIQSDWHQQGRKKGYREPKENELATLVAERDELATDRRYAANAEREAELDAQLEKIQSRIDELGGGDPGVPDAPFKTTWPELAMKRVIRYAAEHGYDRVSWDTGATNADRYDLSKQVRELSYNGDDRLIATGHKGETLINKIVTRDELPDVIGKETADRLLAQKPHRYSGDIDDNTRHLTGTDLKVGGEGMMAFYDKQLPIIAGKLAKRFGSTVEDIAIGGKHRDEQGRFATEDDGAEKFTAHSIAVTDTMRDNVMGGQPLFSPRITGENKSRTYTPEQEAMFKRVGRTVERKSIGEIFNEMKDGLGQKFVRQVLDPYVGIKGRDPLGYLAARIANDSTGAFDMFVKWGTLKFDGRAYRMDKETGGVANDVVRRLGDEAGDFLWWVAANRAEKLTAEMRERLYTAKDIAEGKSLAQGKLDEPYDLGNGKTTMSREAAYLDALKRYDAYNKNALDIGADAGLLMSRASIQKELARIRADTNLSAEKKDAAIGELQARDSLWANPFYVPMFRQAEQEGTRGFVGSSGSGMVGQTPGKRLKGGTEKLNPNLWENAFGNWAHMIDAALRNKAANQILEKGVADGIAERISIKEHDHEMTKAEKAETVWTMVDGERQYWRVTDENAMKAITALDFVETSGALMKVGRAAKGVLQVGVAASPLFQVRNLIKDTEQSIAVSPISRNVFGNMASGTKQQDVVNGLLNVKRAVLAQELQPGQISRQVADAIAGGATMRYASGVDTGFAKAATYLNTPEKLEKFWGYLGRVGEASKNALGFSENVNRLALYDQLIKQGVPHDYASFQGRDLSDFTLKGAGQIVRHLTDLVAYLNPWLQGLYKVGRAAADSDRNIAVAVGSRVATRMATRVAGVLVGMTALNTMLDAIYADDEDYKNRNEYDRNSNFWFKIGGTEFRVPMGFEVAALSRLASIWTETLYDTDMTVGRAWQNTLSIVGTNMNLSPIPQALKPAYDLATNETRTGSTIENTGQRRLQPESRYTADTSMFARWMSDALNATQRTLLTSGSKSLSPVQIDYLVQAYTGWLGTMALKLSDEAIRPLTSEPEQPSKDFLAGMTGGMISNERTSEKGSGRYVQMLYDQGNAIEQAYASYRDLISRGRTTEAKEFFADNEDMIRRHGIVSGAMRAESQLNHRIKLIEESPALSGEEKRVMIMGINSRKNRLAEQAVAPR